MATKPTVTPRWAQTAGGTPATNITTPSSGQQDTGWTVGQAPPSSYFNWLLQLIYSWVLYLADAAFVATSGSGLAGMYGTGDGTGAGGNFTGGGTGTGGSGVVATAGGTASAGVTANGSGTGAGIVGRGGASGPGAQFYPNNIAAPAAANVNLLPLSATPSTLANGDMWIEDVAGVWHLKVRMNGITSTIV